MRNQTVLNGETNGRKSYDFGQASEGAPCRSFPDTQFFRDVSPRASLCSQIGNPGGVHHDFRPAQPPTLGASDVQTALHLLGNSSALLFGDRGDDGDYSVLNDSARIEILLSEAPASFSLRRNMLAGSVLHHGCIDSSSSKVVVHRIGLCRLLDLQPRPARRR